MATRMVLDEQMQQRYGTARRPWGLYLVGVLLAALVVCFVGLWGLRLADPGVQWALRAWQVESPTQVGVVWETRKAAGTQATCVVRAQDTDRVDVGYAIVPVDPAPAVVRTTYRLTTLAPATTVEVLGCAVGTEPPAVAGPQFFPGQVPPDQPEPGRAP